MRPLALDFYHLLSLSDHLILILIDLLLLEVGHQIRDDLDLL